MSNYDLFHRDFSINIGGIRIASRLFDETRQELGLAINEITDVLRVSFRIVKTTKKEPNKADISIYNLKEDNRVQLQSKEQEVILEAGYIENTSVIFKGQLSHGENVYNANTWVTSLQSADGQKQMQRSRINLSLKGNVSPGDALKKLAGAMGLKPGNLKDAIAKGSLREGFKGFQNGLVMSGKTEQQLHKLARSMGLTFSVQDGQLMLVGPRQFLGDQAILLSSATGMLGSPQAGEDGYITVRSYLQPLLQPFYRVKVESRTVNGFFRIEKSTFVGDSWGAGSGSWYVDLECKPL